MTRLRRVAAWLGGDLPSGMYDGVRVSVALGAIVSFAVWVATSGPVAVLGYRPLHTLPVRSVEWWVVLVSGTAAAAALGARLVPRVSEAIVAVALQACGADMSNWAHRAVLFAALLLVFVPAKQSTAPAWPLRVLQLQLPVGYLFAGIMKLTRSDEWRSGTAFRHLFAHPMNQYQWVRVPFRVQPLLDVAGVGAELLGGVILLAAVCSGSRILRRTGLAISAALHIAISLVVPVGLFLFAVAPYWLAHVDLRQRRSRWWAWALCSAAGLSLGLLLGPGNPFARIAVQ